MVNKFFNDNGLSSYNAFQVLTYNLLFQINNNFYYIKSKISLKNIFTNKNRPSRNS